MNRSREFAGYIIGFLLFILLVPYIMVRVTGEYHPGPVRIVLCILLGISGICFSIWSIVYMRLVGKGNPMDAFNHEVAPRTSVLMTDGPYKLCRNPMLLGVFVYYLGLIILLGSLKAAAIFAVFIFIMSIQVKHEERRLEAEFGDEYAEYKKTTKKIIPYIW